jgi:hypothetical protein
MAANQATRPLILLPLVDFTKNLLSRVLWILVLPNADHLPTGLTESRIIPLVAGLRPGNLCPPPLSVPRGEGAVSRTAVPKAAIDEDGYLQPREDNICLAP